MYSYNGNGKLTWKKKAVLQNQTPIVQMCMKTVETESGMEMVQTIKSEAHKLRMRMFLDLVFWLNMPMMTKMLAVVPMTEEQQ